MKRIKEYKKLFKIEGAINLKELKTAYRGLVKEWHPDKFLEEDKKIAAKGPVGKFFKVPPQRTDARV